MEEEKKDGKPGIEQLCRRTSVYRETRYTIRQKGGELFIEGYFAVFNDRYVLKDGIEETILPGAFDLERDKDIRALDNHDTTRVLGRTVAGTLILKVDPHGLWGSICINRKDRAAMNLYEKVKRRDISQCSIGFDILKEKTVTEGGKTVFKISSVKLYEVSVCTFPAYEGTNIDAREKDPGGNKAGSAGPRKNGSTKKDEKINTRTKPRRGSTGDVEKWRRNILEKLRGGRR